MSREDYNLMARIRSGDVRRNWNAVKPEGEKNQADSESWRFQYYDGKLPNWPELLTQAELTSVAQAYRSMHDDDRDIETIIRENKSGPLGVATKGLIQMTMGCPQPIYNGGLLTATVRHFDPDRLRPGLPEGVAALVEELKADRVGLQLVNTSPTETRRVLIQSGGYGEHTFESVSFGQGDVERTLPVNDKHFEVVLPPSTGIRVTAGLRRFTNKPSYAFPWHGDKIPVPNM